MTDPVQGLELEHVIEDVLTYSAWGLVRFPSAGIESESLADLPREQVEALLDCWTWNGEAPSAVPPAGAVFDGSPLADGHVATFDAWVRFLFPDKKGASTEALIATKQARRDVKNRFLEQQGLGLRPHYDKLLEAMFVKPSATTDHAAAAPSAAERAPHHVLPSVFQLLRELHARKRSFSLVLRTFGEDAVSVAEELNRFHAGQHPDEPLPVSDEAPRIRFDLADNGNGMGCIFRSRDDAGGYAAPSAEQVHWFPGSVAGGDWKSGTPDAFLAAPAKPMASGWKAVFELFQGVQHNPGRALVVRDHFWYWRRNGEKGHVGKCLPVDPSDRRTWHVFFDDHIRVHRAKIVDVRDVRTLEPIPYAESKGVFLQQVDPIQVIQDPGYFVRIFDECEARWLALDPAPAP